MLKALPAIEPGMMSIFENVANDDRFAVGAPRPITLGRMLRTAGKLFRVIRRAWLQPDKRREAMIRHVHAEFVAQVAKSKTSGDLWKRYAKRVADLATVEEAFIRIVPVFATALAGLIPFAIIGRMARRHVPNGMGQQMVLELSRGLQHNVTTEMDMALWEVSQRIRSHADGLLRFSNDSIENLTADYLKGKLPPTAQRALDRFIENYGARGLAEIDFGRPRWRERPEQLLRTIRSYLEIEDPERSPEHVFEHGKFAAQVASQQLSSAVQTGLFGNLRKRQFNWGCKTILGAGWCS